MSKPISIDKRSFDLQAADWIRHAVMSGELPLGARVTEVALADQIGLSRSTVRTAMQRLANEGVLVQRAYTGWEVASLTAEDAWELYTLRCGLEGLASKLAAERVDDAGRQTLRAALEELSRAVEAKDRRHVAEADIDLHRAIVGLAGHRRLATMHSQIIDPIHLCIQATNRTSFDGLVPMHTQLVEAILCGDAAAAQRLACDHVTFSGEQVVKQLGGLPSGPKSTDSRTSTPSARST
jgi:DNA-binding GntR family transcriptional regulator